MFFDFSWSEILIVMVVALIVIGPKEIPTAMRALGRIVGQLRRAANEFRRQFDETMREAGGEDLQRELNELRNNNPLSEFRNTVENATRDIKNSASLNIEELASGGQPSSSAQTSTGDAKTSTASTATPEQVVDAAPAKSSGDDAAINNDKPTVK
ncbi:MAG: Sec-independent protein translocase protein TatB [Alphaproteobacteria bacterium]